jgi:nucleoside-diphosphate-sugar epimerase
MNTLSDDLNQALAQNEADVWEGLRRQRIFLTGGTGFFGRWLLELFAWANDQLGLGAKAYVLTRDPASFATTAPHLARHAAIQLVAGDARSFEFPKGGFDYVIHGAIDYTSPPDLLYNAMDAMKRTLEFAVAAGAQKYLFTSSGAIYGTQPPTLSLVDEDFAGVPPADGWSAYAKAKREGESLCADYRGTHGLQSVIARGFAFLGPYLPLHLGSAIGNFIGDALQNRPIEIRGDGTPMRSYLYGADLATWLWMILLRGAGGRSYNVGSDCAIAIGDAARLVAEVVNPKVPIRIAAQPVAGQLPARYVPSIDRARRELGLQPWVDLREGIKRTANWHRARML